MLLTDIRTKVIEILNNSQLPIDAIYYIMKDIMREIELVYNEALIKENNKLKEEEQQKIEEEENSSSENN